MAAPNPPVISPTDKMITRLSSGYFLGPVPVAQFMQDVLPLASAESSTESPRNPFDKVWRKSRTLNDACDVNMIKRFIAAAKRFVPSCILRAQVDKPDPLSEESADVGFYKPNASPNVTDFADLELSVSVYSNEALDPFNDAPTLPSLLTFPFERASLRHRELRARIAAQASAMFNLQPRLHLFSVLLIGPLARIIRWDAAGALVTEAFPYATTNHLVEFLNRFDRLDPQQRGYDPSITRIADPCPTTLAPSDVLTRLKSHDSSAEHPRHRYFALMKTPDRKDTSVEYDLLVSLPFEYDKDAPFGRSTRPTLAYDVALGKVVFAKQYWRVNSGPYVQQKEGDIYSILESHDVRHLPVFGKGNDVRDISTLTDVVERREERRWGFKTQELVSYRLYRMTLETIGRKLTEFTSARELVSAMRDAMQCHDDAFFKANILHRDISPGNIMINVEDGRGFLTDWDSCLDMSTATEVELTRRMGTWECMSAEQLSAQNKPHTIADDRESALWVLTWVALTYCPFKSDKPLMEWLAMFTEHSVGDPFYGNGPVASMGGEKKIAFILGHEFQKRVQFELSPGLAPLIILLKRLFICRYELGGHLDKDLRKFEEALGETERSDQLRKQLDALFVPKTLVDIFDLALSISEAWSATDDPATPHGTYAPTGDAEAESIVHDSNTLPNLTRSSPKETRGSGKSKKTVRRPRRKNGQRDSNEPNHHSQAGSSLMPPPSVDTPVPPNLERKANNKRNARPKIRAKTAKCTNNRRNKDPVPAEGRGRRTSKWEVD